MGVPSFYAWVLQRYPKLIQHLQGVISDAPDANAGAGPIDNLYLDMNGIIHPCFHPENGEAPATEEECFMAILAYIDALMFIVRPRKLLYLAVDGPAPRAKMNQQRGRRFKAAAEADQKKRVEDALRSQWRQQGKAAPEAKEDLRGVDPMADSNVITPGTQFMTRLGRWLRHFCYARLNSPAEYDHHGLRIVLSDAAVPGEGEHKAMAYIRAQRHARGYDPNLHHCLYGLDADLIMLGLATHEARFTILREAKPPRRGGAPRAPPPQRPDWPRAANAHGYELCYIHVLRDYLHRELAPPAADWSGVRQGFVLDRAIADFVFLCFFVGNDFLPHMPALEIRDGAIDALLQLYKTNVSTRLGGYLTSNGEVNLQRVEALMMQLGQLEQLIFERRRHDEQHQARRREAQQRQRRLDELSDLDRAISLPSSSYRGQAAAQRDAIGGSGPAADRTLGRAGRVLAGKGSAEPTPLLAGAKRGRDGSPTFGDDDEEEEELDGGSVAPPPPRRR